MHSYLVVANRTLGGTKLVDELYQRAIQDRAAFHVVVPATRPHEHLMWTEGAANVGAGKRLNEILRRLDQSGISATGSVGDTNPVDAANNLLREGAYDEIILATTPAGVSRLIHADLPHRLARRTRVPVAAVTAAPAA